MRISDWSSDVCSSDREAGRAATAGIVVTGRGLPRQWCARGGRVGLRHDRTDGLGAARVIIHLITLAACIADRHHAATCPTGCRGRALIAAGRRQGGRGRATTIHRRSEEHTSELQSLMRISYDVFFLKKKKQQ